jgi:hypothetical protein
MSLLQFQELCRESALSDLAYNAICNAYQKRQESVKILRLSNSDEKFLSELGYRIHWIEEFATIDV